MGKVIILVNRIITEDRVITEYRKYRKGWWVINLNTSQKDRINCLGADKALY
jgi:hypothetical protein